MDLGLDADLSLFYEGQTILKEMKLVDVVVLLLPGKLGLVHSLSTQTLPAPVSRASWLVP